MRRFNAVPLLLAISLSACGGSTGVSSGNLPGGPGIPGGVAASPVQHVVVIIQENRTFDNLFNGFPGANTATSGVDHNGKTVALQPISLSSQYDPDHAHPSLQTEYDNGKMDGFDLDTCDFNAFNPPSFACQPPFFGPPANFTYGYVPGGQNTDTLIYWLLAQSYGGLADEMFSTRQVPSFPGHQFLIAGQGPADDPVCAQSAVAQGCKSSIGLSQGIWGCDAPPGTIAGQFGATYISPEIFVNPPCYDYNALGDLMNQKGVSWKYYTGQVGTVDGLISAYDAIRHIRYSPSWTTNISTPMTNILNDIQNNTLPAVSFVTPPAPASDHAGFLGAAGPGWVGEIMLFLAQNKNYNANTAVFVVWDDSGGWYDHVPPPCYDNRVLPAPPTCDQNGPLGFRVPLLALSPYAIKQVNHDVHSYGSILHYIEKNWALGSLGQDDAIADDLSDMFDYSKLGQPPIVPLTHNRRFMGAMSRYSKAFFRNLHGNHAVDSE